MSHLELTVPDDGLAKCGSSATNHKCVVLMTLIAPSDYLDEQYEDTTFGSEDYLHPDSVSVLVSE